MALNKRAAATGSFEVTLYRMFLLAVFVIALMVGSSIFYDHRVHVRDTEAILMGRHLVDCFAKNGVVEWKSYDDEKSSLFDLCNIKAGEPERFFMRLRLFDPETSQELILSQGDSGALWVKQVFEFGSDGSVGSLKHYEPGYFTDEYEVNLVREGQAQGKGTLTVEVLIHGEI